MICFVYLLDEMHTLGGLQSICIVDYVWYIVLLAQIGKFNKPKGNRSPSAIVYIKWLFPKDWDVKVVYINFEAPICWMLVQEPHYVDATVML